MDNENTPIVNSSELSTSRRLWRMWAGQIGTTWGYVWADDEESAFEAWVEYLDENAPGCLVSHEEFRELLAQAIQDLAPQYVRFKPEITQWGMTWQPLDHQATVDAFHADHALCGVIDSELAERVLEHAEADLTTIGHTSLTHGAHIPSYEWGLDEIDSDSDEYRQAHARTLGLLKLAVHK